MTLDYVVVGAGPAGLQMAHFLERAGRRYVVLEAGERAGTFFERFPRHRFLLSLNKRHNWFPEPEFNLRHDWNSLLSDDVRLRFTRYTDALYPNADVLVRYLNDYARRLALKVSYRSRVVNVSRRPEGGFTVTDDSGRTYACRAVFIGTGAVRPRVPADVDGIEHVLGYENHPLDPRFYEGKRVAIVGRGNSAFEVGNHLAGHAAIVHLFVGKPVKHAWHTHYPGDLRAINNTLLDMYQLKSLHATLGFRLKAVLPRSDGALTLVVEEEYPHWNPPRVGRVTLTYDHVIRCTGWRYADPDIFPDDGRPDLDADGKFPRLSTTWESTIPDLFYIGTAMQSIDRRAASSFIHGFRYNIRTLFHLLEERYFGVPLGSRSFDVGDEQGVNRLAAFLIERVSTTSALYQQFGVLADALVLSGGTATYLPELPVEWLLDSPRFRAVENLVVITLEYGFHRYPSTVSTLEFIHPADPAMPHCSAFLHPVLRHYRHGVLQQEVELGESLVVRYDHADYAENADAAHENRLRNFLRAVLGRTGSVFYDGVYDPDVEQRVLRPWPGERPAPVPVPGRTPECAFVRESA